MHEYEKKTRIYLHECRLELHLLDLFEEKIKKDKEKIETHFKAFKIFFSVVQIQLNAYLRLCVYVVATDLYLKIASRIL